MTELELRQQFKNLSDCYADTCEHKDSKLVEGVVIQAMTEDRFIETLKQVKLFALPVNCPLCGGEKAFAHPENCMTEGCPNCVF